MFILFLIEKYYSIISIYIYIIQKINELGIPKIIKKKTQRVNGFSDKIDIILMAYFLYCFSIIGTIVSEYALYKMNILSLYLETTLCIPR